ncbi:MAG: 2-oxoglutarate dehydrogenase complex dihydrolipoyllysine-residue succinyltransferase [Gemmatimonadaceae bacterium]|nr:2-oxoglutarate dehydrogenase complex dihydrolipoyllysine-residue succinyltransferase [Gemmatimonadaceae bacterium]
MVSIKVPPLGESITEATVSRWLKKEGDAVAAGDTLVELETDKITVEVPSLKAGVLVKRLHAEGDVVAVNDVLGQLDDAATGTGTSAPAPPPTAQPVTTTATAAPRPSAAPSDVRSAPSARKLADEAGINIGAVAGTGRGGVVSRPDVVAAMAAPVASPAPSTPPPAPQAPPAPPAPPAPATPVAAASATSATDPNVIPTQFAMQRPASETMREVREKMTTRRKRIAENLLAAQQSTAHLTTFNEIDMSAVSALRARMKERVEQAHGVKLTFMAFFARAAVIALEEFRNVNASVDGDTIVYHNFVNIGVAVANDAGLVVPNIKDAQHMGVLALAKAIAETAQRARDGKLTIDDLTGGTFTLTNGGVFGSLVSTPIINFPQSGILGLHKIQDRPVVVDGQIVVRPMMYVALSYDHRIIEGQHAVLFLVRVKELMEDPESMLIS